MEIVKLLNTSLNRPQEAGRFCRTRGIRFQDSMDIHQGAAAGWASASGCLRILRLDGQLDFVRQLFLAESIKPDAESCQQ